MHRNPMIARGALAALMVAILFSTGCQGFFAQRKIDKIDGQLNEIRPLNPDTHKKAEWENANRTLTNLKAQLTGDPSGANSGATQLAESVETLVTEVKAAESSALLAEANRSRTIMDQNDGRSINTQRYQEISDELAKADTAYREQRYDEAITSSRKVISDIDQLLLPARQLAESNLNELRDDRRQMDVNECPTYAPEIVTSVDQAITRVEQLITTERHYLQAQATARRGKVSAQEGITKANRIRAQLRINELENRLGFAVEEGAEIYCLEQLNQANSTFDLIIQSFFANEFERVLSTIEILRPTVDSLIFCTLSRSSNDKIEQLLGHARRHLDGGVPEYLPGRVERLQEMVDAARADYEITAQNPDEFPRLPTETKANIEKSFGRIKAQLQEAFLFSEKIDQAFDDLAGTALRDSEFELNIAEQLFGDMEGAFLVPTPADVTPLDPSFTNNKGSLQTELRTRISNARISLDEAKILRSRNEFRNSIERARAIESTSKYISSQIYRVVGDNAIIELENQITRFTREGAAEYAADDLALTRTLLNEAKALMQRSSFKEAVDQAARVRAQFDVTLQVLGRSVLDMVESARAAIEKSEELRASQFAPETIGRARTLVDQAQSELTAKSYRRAIQLAEQGRTAATEAEAEAGLKWSRNELDTARDQQALADEADAIVYAPLLMRQAQNQYATARDLREKGSYQAAALAAQEAAKSFRDALHKRLDEANEAILTARRSEGWKYEQGELTKSIVKSEQAAEALAAGTAMVRNNEEGARSEFQRSLRLAEQSRTIAQEVIEASQKAGIQERLTRIQKSLNETINTGANYFQVSEVKRLLEEAERVKASASYRTYEDVIAELNRIDAEFENVLNSTPDRVAGLIAQQRARLDTLEEEHAAADIAPEALRNARRQLEYTEIDFKEGRFTGAYGNLRQGLDAVALVEASIAERDYQIKVTKLFREMNEALVRFDAVIKLGPDVMRRIAYGIEGRGRAVAVANAMPPTQFKQVIDDIYLAVLDMTPPPTREQLHREVVRTVNEARLAAAEFQKILIFDELDRRTINDTVRSAYEHHGNMVKLRSEVQQRLLDTGADLDGVPEDQVRPFERIVLTQGG